PTVDQWEKAAGYYDRDDARQDEFGPFLRLDSPRKPDDIAVGRTAPLPVGAAEKDRSRFGCRDMAGEGLEWTRPPKDKPLVAARRQRFNNPDPLQFEQIGPTTLYMSEMADKARSFIGFRVVAEDLVGGATR